ncbi:alpha/beta hydrolase [Variovorax sp. J22G73]|uniref:alpha/beta fold hydrolase n=1 Tax=unclassified Variovorax TaxID=663243 RepID=UPI0025790E7D|nr:MULTISPECIES: alpha/beta hydrolase [unclassified Variovorax]MDM0097102.1 alpha/beta hydrolase [Variovorax sp. J22G73]
MLLPGMDGTGDLFAPLTAALGPGAAVDVVRYSGTQPQSYAELEPLVRAQLPREEPFVLLGESFSGPLAISIAAAPPPGLRGLILCCSFARSPSPGLALLRGGLLELMMKLLHLDAMRPPMRHMLLGRFATPQLAGMLQGSLRQVSGAVMARRMHEVQRVNVVDKLAQVRVPSMYLQALQDRIVPAQAALVIQRALAGLQVVRFEGPHGLLQAAPAATAQAIDHFCRTLGDPAPIHP